MSVMFETLERLERKRDDGSTSFNAEVWSIIDDRPVFEPKYPSLWAEAVDLWKSFFLTLHDPRPKIRAAALAIANAVQQSWARVQQAVLERTPVSLDENFRAGLDNWISRENAPASSWWFDAAGLVHPGKLALYRPSIGLADYQMQFLGTIDKQALSWVVRAADFDNYYAVELAVLKPGPLPAIGVTRYAVINGKIQNRVTTPLAIPVRSDTLYRVRLDVRDNIFQLKVQDQLVDVWFEPRLQRGGIGFFSQENAKSGVSGVQVRSGHDVLGLVGGFRGRKLSAISSQRSAAVVRLKADC